MCSDCLNFPCVPERLGGPGKKTDTKSITSYCKDCFKVQSSLDFDKSVDVVGPEKGQVDNTLFCFIYIMRLGFL